ncbi:MAG: DUF975 family protein [bacterium]|nr:DUF975 family protein [bacterium]
MEAIAKTENWVEITKTYTEAWEFFKKHWVGVYKIGIIAFLLIFAVSFTLGIFVAMVGEESLLGSILELVAQIWSQFVSIGATLVTLNFLRNDGATFSIEDFFAGKERFIQYIFANIAYALVVLLGLVLLIIPGIIWAIKYSYVPVLIIDKPVGIREAFSESARMTDGVKWKLFWFDIFGLVVLLGGLLLLGVGLFIAVPVIFLAMYMLYNKLLARTKLGIAQ